MNARTKDPMLLPQDCLSLLDMKLQKEGGSIELANAVIYFAEDHEEELGIEDGVMKIEQCPSFILSRLINGKAIRTAHPTLADAIRGLE